MTPEEATLEPDHLIVWGDVEMLADDVSRALGLDPIDGGVHPGRGTCNMLFAMEGDRFLEVLGPDRDQAGRVVGPLDHHPHGALWWWAARSEAPLADVRDRLTGMAVEAGPVEPGSRIRPGGERLTWETFDPNPEPFVPALPFVIRWTDGPPIRDRTPCCVLRALRLCHPDAAGLSAIVTALGLIDDVIQVEQAASPGLSATIEGPAGMLELATPGLATS